MKRLIVILDRDGVLIHNDKSMEYGPHYIMKADQIKIKEGVIEGFSALKGLCPSATFVVITKQNCIAKGLAALAEVQLVNNYLEYLLPGIYDFRVYWGAEDDVSASAAIISSILYNFFVPMPGGIVDQESCSTWIIDDSQSRLQAAKSFGINTIYVSNPYCRDQIIWDYRGTDEPNVKWGDYIVKDFMSAVKIIADSLT